MDENDDYLLIIPKYLLHDIIEMAFNDGFNTRANSSISREECMRNEIAIIMGVIENKIEKGELTCLLNEKHIK